MLGSINATLEITNARIQSLEGEIGHIIELLEDKFGPQDGVATDMPDDLKKFFKTPPINPDEI